MYQVIARSWRPQKFSEVIGQKHVTQTLQNAIRLNRTGHGYIFSGQRGVGKTTVARLLAKALNCQKGPAPEPCGECDSCREIAAGRSVDVIEIDAASNRGIDAIRELRENVRYSPARDRYKVFIVDEAHQITPEGFNALLKTLEEPPPHVVFVLATTEVHQLPETILSRCQHFAFRAAGFPEILAQLRKICEAEGVVAEDEALAAVAAAAEGSMRDALSRLEQAIAACGAHLEGPAVERLLGAVPSQRILEVFTAVREHRRDQVLEIVARLTDDGYQLADFCAQLTRAVRNLLVIRVSGPQQSLLETSEEKIKSLQEIAEHFPVESLMRFLDILLKLNQEVRHSMDPRFQTELGLLKLVDAERLVAIEDLLARLEGEQPAANTAPSVHGTPISSPASSPPSSPVSGRELPAAVRDSGIKAQGMSPFERDSLRKAQKAEPIQEGPVSPAPTSSASRASGEVPTKGPAEVPASAPASQASSTAGDAALIQEVLRRVEERSKPMLANVISSARRWEFGESEVSIQLQEGGLARMVTEADRQLLDNILTEVTGRKIRVRWAGSTTAPAGIGSGRVAGAAAPSVQERVRSDPEVQEFEKTFGKPVERVRKWGE